MAFINEKKVNWDLTTPNSGLLLKEEYEQLYDNDNYLKTEVERVDTDFINHEKDYFTYGIVQGFEVTLSQRPDYVEVSEGIARDQAGRRMQRSAATVGEIATETTVKVVCRFTETEIIIALIPVEQEAGDNELVLAQVTRSGEAVTIVDERIFAGLVVNNIDHPQGVLIEGERVAKYRSVLLELAILHIRKRTVSFGDIGGFLRVCYGNGCFVALRNSDDIISSSDGLSWTKRIGVPYFENHAVCYANGLFVVVGDEAGIQKSQDGTTWTSCEYSGPEYNLTDICYGNGLFVAVGNNGGIILSPDGITWTEQAAGITTNFTSVCYGNGYFVALENGGEIQISQDGKTWTKGTSTNSYALHICYGNGLFVAVGVFYTIETSPDGIIWTNRYGPTGTDMSTLECVYYTNGLFVAVGIAGQILTSPDGITWTQRQPADNYSGKFGGICFGNGSIVIVGESDEIQSTPRISFL